MNSAHCARARMKAFASSNHEEIKVPKQNNISIGYFNPTNIFLQYTFLIYSGLKKDPMFRLNLNHFPGGDLSGRHWQKFLDVHIPFLLYNLVGLQLDGLNQMVLQSDGFTV